MTWKPDYITAEAFRAFRRIDDAIDDAQIAPAITAASRAIDRLCHRQFGKVDAPVERRYTPRRVGGRWVVDIDDLMSTAGLVVMVDAGEVTADSYTLEPVNAAVDGLPWTRITIEYDAPVQPCGRRYEAGITAPWGWSVFPVAVVEACTLQTNRFASRRGAPFGIAGSPDQGSEMRLLARVDPDVAVSLSDYVRPEMPR